MPFKSLINIRSICPLAETQRPVNANEWESKAIRVHYRLPLVSIAASLLADHENTRPTTQKYSVLQMIDGTHAFCILREKVERILITEKERQPGFIMGITVPC